VAINSIWEKAHSKEKKISFAGNVGVRQWQVTALWILQKLLMLEQ
jgi:hypothetical protein